MRTHYFPRIDAGRMNRRRMSEPLGTRDRLIAAAENLFAAQGVGAVSLREIVRASGARNATALQYHFGDRAGLVRALLDRHAREVDARRHALLDAFEQHRPAKVRALAAALVLPLAAKLADPSGRDFLQILAELMNQPRPLIDIGPDDSFLRWREVAEPMLDPGAVRFHRRFLALRFTVVELARRADSAPHTDDRLFVSHLVDLVAALLTARASAETTRLAADRDAATDREATDREAIDREATDREATDRQTADRQTADR
jgi:AcrR family transcriptional regulator